MTQLELNNKTHENYRKITFEEMKTYIETVHPEDKEKFKTNAIKNGKYVHVSAYRWFYDTYRPELLEKQPKTKKPSKAVKALAEW